MPAVDRAPPGPIATEKNRDRRYPAHGEIRPRRPHRRHDGEGIRQHPGGVLRQRRVRPVRPDRGPLERRHRRVRRRQGLRDRRRGQAVLLPLRAPVHRGRGQPDPEGVRGVLRRGGRRLPCQRREARPLEAQDKVGGQGRHLPHDGDRPRHPVRHRALRRAMPYLS